MCVEADQYQGYLAPQESLGVPCYKNHQVSAVYAECTLSRRVVVVNVGVTSEQRGQLLVVVDDVPLHDVHAGAQQTLKRLHVHH